MIVTKKSLTEGIETLINWMKLHRVVDLKEEAVTEEMIKEERNPIWVNN